MKKRTCIILIIYAQFVFTVFAQFPYVSGSRHRQNLLGIESSFSLRNPPESQILQDLVGKVIIDPSPNSYFPISWSWTIKKGDISHLTTIHETIESNYYIALITIHLKRRQMPVDVKAIIQYRLVDKRWQYDKLIIQNLSFPPQQNYKSCINIYEDYDFVPSLMVKNSCNMTLFVAGSYMATGEPVRFCVELEPYQEEAIAIGPSINKYSIHFAYREDGPTEWAEIKAGHVEAGSLVIIEGRE